MNVVREVSITSTVLGPLAKICVTTRSVFGPWHKHVGVSRSEAHVGPRELGLNPKFIESESEIGNCRKLGARNP